MVVVVEKVDQADPAIVAGVEDEEVEKLKEDPEEWLKVVCQIQMKHKCVIVLSQI